MRLVWDSVRVRVAPAALGRRRGAPDSEDVEVLDVVRVRMVREEGKATVLGGLLSLMRGVAVAYYARGNQSTVAQRQSWTEDSPDYWPQWAYCVPFPTTQQKPGESVHDAWKRGH